MALNPQYDSIGKAFTQQYYAMFDDPTQRHQLVNLYNVRSLIQLLYPAVESFTMFFEQFQAESSLMTFEGQQMQGSPKIMEKLGSLTFQKIAHLVRQLAIIMFLTGI
jgi:hypothetical protein